MNRRIASIDIMRGITIAAMILCANIGFNSNLPAWMFHAQTPPPTYAFNPNIPGITWVDLVFPFFLFTMGAAIPLALRKRIENGQQPLNLVLTLLKRWFILTIFALVLGNAYSIGGALEQTWPANIFKIVLWGGLFLSLVRAKSPVINWLGILTIAIIGIITTKCFGIPLQKSLSDIIILILANIALWGGLIWLATKDKIWLRWLIFLFIAAIKALDSYCPDTLSFIPSTAPISWLFQWEFLQYLLIAIPGSIIGDMILDYSRKGWKSNVGKKEIYAGFVAFAVVIIQLWGLYAREVAADFIISLVGAALYLLLSRGSKSITAQIAKPGFVFLLVGIAFDPVDGGITKDYANLSYLFTTAGMGALLLSFLLMLETRMGFKGSFVAGVGQNPMLAYTVTSFLIGPVLTLCFVYPLLSSLAEGSQFWGMVMGIFMTLAMMGTTYLCTKFKLFWRS